MNSLTNNFSTSLYGISRKSTHFIHNESVVRKNVFSGMNLLQHKIKHVKNEPAHSQNKNLSTDFLKSSYRFTNTSSSRRIDLRSYSICLPKNEPTFRKNKQASGLLLLTALVAGFFFTKTSSVEHPFGSSPPVLSKKELNQLADSLNISKEGSEEAIKNKCFQKLIEECLEENWIQIEQNKDLVGRITDSTGKTLFLRMVEEGRGEQIKQLCSRGIKYDYCDSEGNNGLHIATMNGYSALIPFLSNKFGINDLNKHKKAPLHLAAERGHSQVVGTLLKNGASDELYWESPEGISYSSLALAIQSGDISTFEKLFKKRPSRLKETTPQIGTVLHLAIKTRKSEKCPILQHILTQYHEQAKDLLFQADDEGRIPFHLAAYEGVTSIILFLVKDQGVSVNYADNKGRTAVHWAVMGEKPDVIKQLDWLDANLTLPDKTGLAPIALIKGRAESSLESKECRNLLERLPTMSKAAKEEPHDYIQRPPYNLVFQGGGGKGIAYVGIVKGLEGIGWLPKVSRVAGTSAGSIAASLLSVGYSSKELEKELGRDFSEFLDPIDSFAADILRAGQQGDKLSPVRSALKEYWNSPGWNPIAKAKALQNKLLETTGLCKGDALLSWISELIERKTGIPNCTFKELHELKIKEPEKYKDLYVYALRLKENENHEIVRFSHEDPVLQDVVIADAVRASASIPGVFKPHTLHVKPAHYQSHPYPDLGRFVDGGLIKNFPIDAFDDNKYQNEPKERGSKTNHRTLGFKFETPTDTTLNLDNNIDLGKAIISAFYNAEEILLAQLAHNKDRIVKIPMEATGLTELNFEEKKKQRSIQSAENAFRFFFRRERS